jgi:hypothetical protein
MRQPRMMAKPDDRWEPRLHPGSRGSILTKYGLYGWLSYVRPRGPRVRRVGHVLSQQGVYRFKLS